MALATAKSTANAVWEGSLMEGSGQVGASSGAFSDLGVSWAARTDRGITTTSPEELLASSHAACYCMALSNGLTQAGTPPTKLEVSATVTFAQQEVGWKVASSALTVTGSVPGSDGRELPGSGGGRQRRLPYFQGHRRERRPQR